MATRTANSLTSLEMQVKRYQWTGLLNGDDGTPLEFAVYADRSIQVTGTFGTGGTLVAEGSNDGTNYVTLKDPLGAAVSFTAAGIKQIGELAHYIRPRVTAGDGTTTLVATILMRSGAR
jgi:hypothetical protein